MEARVNNLLPPAVQPRLLGNTPRFHCRLPLPRPLAADDDEEPAEAPGSGGNGGGRVVLENTSPLPGLLGPLVDYGDDDDEEGDTLPLRGAWVRGVQLQVGRRIDAMPQEWFLRPAVCPAMPASLTSPLPCLCPWRSGRHA